MEYIHCMIAFLLGVLITLLFFICTNKKVDNKYKPKRSKTSLSALASRCTSVGGTYVNEVCSSSDMSDDQCIDLTGAPNRAGFCNLDSLIM